MVFLLELLRLDLQLFRGLRLCLVSRMSSVGEDLSREIILVATAQKNRILPRGISWSSKRAYEGITLDGIP